MKKLKNILILILLLLLYTFTCAYSYAQTVSNDISDNVFRLHVIANSDSEEDQNLKYKVRDSIITYMEEICQNCNSKEEAIEIAKNNEENFKQIALQTIKENGFDYDVTIEIGNFEFPTKNYGTISLPSGYYDALRIKIGKAEGKNWWCVMFPSLCFIDTSSATFNSESTELLKNNMSTESFAVITENSKPEINFKFKILEIFSTNNLFSAKK